MLFYNSIYFYWKELDKVFEGESAHVTKLLLKPFMPKYWVRIKAPRVPWEKLKPYENEGVKIWGKYFVISSRASLLAVMIFLFAYIYKMPMSKTYRRLPEVKANCSEKFYEI